MLCSTHLLKNLRNLSKSLGCRGITSAGPFLEQGSIQVACILERIPLLKPLLDPWEAEYKSWAEKFKRHKTIPIEFLEGKRSLGDEDGDDDEAEKMASWRPNPRESIADKSGDTKSMLRCLDEHLFLLLKSKQGWEFPVGKMEDGETVRDTAERLIRSVIGSGVQTYFLGNCPFGHIAKEHDPSSKVFYHRAKIVAGTVSMPKACGWSDFAWVSKKEIPMYLAHEAEQKLMVTMLPNVNKKIVRQFW